MCQANLYVLMSVIIMKIALSYCAIQMKYNFAFTIFNEFYSLFKHFVSNLQIVYQYSNCLICIRTQIVHFGIATVSFWKLPHKQLFLLKHYQYLIYIYINKLEKQIIHKIIYLYSAQVVQHFKANKQQHSHSWLQNKHSIQIIGSRNERY